MAEGSVNVLIRGLTPRRGSQNEHHKLKPRGFLSYKYPKFNF